MNNFICLCSKITEKNFCNFINQNFSLSLEEVYSEMDIGNKCSACRLKLEIIYRKEKNNINDSNKTKINYINKFKKHLINISNNLNYFFSFKPVIQNLVAPIFNGNNISTTLIVSNIIPDTFFKYSANFNIEIKIRSKEGRLINKSSSKLNKNSRFVLPLNLQKECNLSNINSNGSVWIKIIPISRGYIGFTRPHIRISNEKFISAIHLQNGKKNGAFINSVFKNNEKQYLSLVNMEAKESSIQLYLNKDINNVYRKILKPYESTLLDINKIFKHKSNYETVDINISHNGTLRRNFLIENTYSNAISIDHI